MKTRILFALVALLGSAVARADYRCSSWDAKQKLEIKEAQAGPAVGAPVTATLTVAASVASLSGVVASREAGLFAKTVYSLTDENGAEATLTLVKRPRIGRGGCGRGSCDFGDDFGGSSLSATLQYEGAEALSFSCAFAAEVLDLP